MERAGVRRIDLESWPRRETFELYRNFRFPCFGVCADVEIGPMRRELKAQDTSFTVGIVYVLARAANLVPEFRQRIRGADVVEHERVHPSITVLTEDDSLSFCTMDLDESFAAFAEDATKAIARAKAHPTLQDEPGRDDLLFMTAIPWISFTSFTHPIPASPPDSVPRIAWGKYREECGRLMMPLAVQAHHALIDGVHAGRFFEAVQGFVSEPARWIR
jgi:chloramphenicol O-acetyltransferase type A